MSVWYIEYYFENFLLLVTKNKRRNCIFSHLQLAQKGSLTVNLNVYVGNLSLSLSS